MPIPGAKEAIRLQCAKTLILLRRPSLRTSRLPQGLPQTVQQRCTHEFEQRSLPDIDVDREGHSGDQAKAFRYIDKICSVDCHTGLVVGIHRLPVLVRCKSSFADPIDPPFRRAMLEVTERIDFNRRFVAGSNKANIPRGKMDFAFEWGTQGNKRCNRVALLQNGARGKIRQT